MGQMVIVVYRPVPGCAEAVEGAHHNPNVQALWSRFAECCTYETLAGLSEAQRLFSPFTPVEL
ncbi:MAG TPA: hypothetical protein VFQ76_05085 [Longimicrobiaceae bacterium]|nr:hypothetical protein [Longimicrobiaceae bacterium]